MRDFTLIKANIRRQKGSFIGVFLLIWIISISLCAVLSVWSNSNDYVRQQVDRIGYGTFTSWTDEVPDMDGLKKQIKELPDVEKVTEQPLIYVRYAVNGEESGSDGLMLAYEPGEYYVFCSDLRGKEDSPKAPGKGEVYVSTAFCSLYDAKIGDKVEVILKNTTEYYTIKGFFEDPIMGSSMMGMKTMLMNPTDWEEMSSRLENSTEKENAGRGYMVHIFQNQKSTLTVSEFQSKVLEDTELGSYSYWNYTKNAMLGFMLILQNIFAGFLLLFVLVLLVVTMIVLGHSISSSIEQDYVDMGILKAVGYTKHHLRMIQMGQYLLAVVLGILAGVPLSIPLIRLVNRMTVTATGLVMPSTLPVLHCVLVLGGIFLLLAVFICIKTGKIGRITPLRAIRGGAEDIYFKSRFTMPVYRRGMSFWLAFRQLVSGKKQYISACMITVLLVFFLSLVGRLDAWIGPEGDGMMQAFGTAPYDIGLKSEEEGVMNEAEQMVSEYTGIEDSYELGMKRGLIDGIDCAMNVISNPDYYNILEGRTCKYENELVLTETMAEELDVSVGDTVTVTYEEKEAEYIITGINQCANDLGANFSMNQKGFARIGEEVNWYTCYILTDTDCKAELIDKLAERFGDRLKIDENTWSGIDAIVAAMSALGMLMYVIVIIFILIVVFLTGSKILYREQHDFGIYKSLGFHSGRLRLMFALRFGIIAALGSAIGIVLSILLTDSLATSVLRMCGISRFVSHISMIGILLPGIEVVLMFFLFAYVASRRIRKVEPAILIVE